MSIDDEEKGGLKIKGQAEVEKRKSKWEDKGAPHVRISLDLFRFLSRLTMGQVGS